MRVGGVWVFALAALAAQVLVAGQAEAKPRITEKVEYYSINGKTGADLLRDMNRKGPRHGFLTKAIAQTRYTTTPRGDMYNANGVCRVKDGGVSMAITYIYPQPRQTLSGDLARRWRIFQADNVRHEKMHGVIARELAGRLDSTIRDFTMKDGKYCGRAMAKLKRDVREIYDKYEARQVAFDEREHRDGGPVEKSIRVLVGKR